MKKTTIPISLNAWSSNIRWIIVGGTVGSILALGAVITVAALVMVILICQRRRKQRKKWEQSKINNDEIVQDTAETNGSLSAPYHSVDGATINDNLQVTSAKERDTQGIQLTPNKACNETDDCTTIQLTQNAAYHSWRVQHNNTRRNTGTR